MPSRCLFNNNTQKSLKSLSDLTKRQFFLIALTLFTSPFTSSTTIDPRTKMGDAPQTSAEAANNKNHCEQFQGRVNLNELTSPNFPLKYPPNVDCIRVVKSPPGYDVVLQFNRDIFQIESAFEGAKFDGEAARLSPTCPNDFLDIRDGRYSFSPLLGRFCGSRPPEFEIRARSGAMYLHFHTDGFLEYRGFSAKFEFIRSDSDNLVDHNYAECHISVENAYDGYVDSSALANFIENPSTSTTISNNGTIVANSNNNNGGLDCVWQISVLAPLRIALYVEEFELRMPNQCYHNFMEFYAGELAVTPSKRTCAILPKNFFSEQPMIFLRFFARSAEEALNSHFRILFSTYANMKDCNNTSFFPCGDDTCIPMELVCNGRVNCAHGLDERNCPDSTGLFTQLLRTKYLWLMAGICLIASAVGALCLYYKPWRKVAEQKARRKKSSQVREPFDAAKILELTTIYENSRPNNAAQQWRTRTSATEEAIRNNIKMNSNASGTEEGTKSAYLKTHEKASSPIPFQLQNGDIVYGNAGPEQFQHSLESSSKQQLERPTFPMAFPSRMNPHQVDGEADNDVEEEAIWKLREEGADEQDDVDANTSGSPLKATGIKHVRFKRQQATEEYFF